MYVITYMFVVIIVQIIQTKQTMTQHVCIFATGNIVDE